VEGPADRSYSSRGNYFLPRRCRVTGPNGAGSSLRHRTGYIYSTRQDVSVILFTFFLDLHSLAEVVAGCMHWNKHPACAIFKQAL
jgi:hypothetical protein